MNNTAGSFALLGAKVPRDSTVAAKLRKAGAIILGKVSIPGCHTVTPLLMIYRPTSANGRITDLTTPQMVGLPTVVRLKLPTILDKTLAAHRLEVVFPLLSAWLGQVWVLRLV